MSAMENGILASHPMESQSTIPHPAQLANCVSTLLESTAELSGDTAPPEHEPDKAAPGREEGLSWCYAAVTPAHIVESRYERTYYHPKEYDGDMPQIEAFQTSYDPVPVGSSAYGDFLWTHYVSPEGNLYFREETKNLLTFVDLYSQKYLDGVSGFAQYLLSILSTQQAPLPVDAEIVIALEEFSGGKDLAYGYYLASWQKRCVFWLNSTEYVFVTKEARVCTTQSHVGKQIEYLFWIHVEMFPCHRGPPQDVLGELKSQLNVGIYDHLSSKKPIFPFDKTEATEVLKCIDRIEAFEKNGHDMWIVARCKQNLGENNSSFEHVFLNYHGERGARIHRDDSVHSDSIHHKRSWLFRIVTPLLFFMPSVYMDEIESVWIDGTVDWISWRRFIVLLSKDWQHSIIPATVILSANVGFLTINSIDTTSPDKSTAQIASYISSVLAFFNFIAIQILTHQHRYSDHFETAKALAFFEKREKHWPGLESVALTFSLPTALFIWSMLTFLGALMIVFFWHTSVATRVSLGCILGILFFVTAILLWLDWEAHWDSREGSILYAICPSGLKNTVLNAKERWQTSGGFRLKKRKSSSGSSVSDVSTVVNSP
ncbi:hypothetical protein BC835DRAFT_1410458 [Cytidiella melzeri]|nr:hypothetical protein BC835DRAFT_1410458 [Cytidiella melzeri]